MSKITVLPTPDLLLERELTGHAAVVIDVLRATSSIATALSSGCANLIPAKNKEEALSIKEDHPNALLTGEIGGLKIPGFDLGNSPLEYTFENVGGKTIIMTTSNGTRAVLGASDSGASPVFLCSFLNMPAVAKACLAACKEEHGAGKDLSILCSGSHGEFSLEDFACAGALALEIVSTDPSFNLDSDARAAVSLFDAYGRDPLAVIRDAPHGRQLIEMGFDDDLAYCAKIGVVDVVPRFVSGTVTSNKDR